MQDANQKGAIQDQDKTNYYQMVEQTNMQFGLIREEIEKNSPLVSPKLQLSTLIQEFQNNPGFLQKIKFILDKTEFQKFRQVRRDGSCFYRAVIFKIFERIIMERDIKLFQQFSDFVESSKKEIVSIGIDDFIIDDFKNIVDEKLTRIKNKTITTENDLMAIFLDQMTSQSFVFYMRLLTSTYVKMNSILFEGFIEESCDVAQFCQKFIDPIDQEADQLQIMALINYLNIPIRIFYLDANIKALEPQVLIIPETAQKEQIFINLLYRPGHYDILY